MLRREQHRHAAAPIKEPAGELQAGVLFKCCQLVGGVGAWVFPRSSLKTYYVMMSPAAITCCPPMLTCSGVFCASLRTRASVSSARR